MSRAPQYSPGDRSERDPLTLQGEHARNESELRCRHCGELCPQPVTVPAEPAAEANTNANANTAESSVFCCTGCVAAWHILQGRPLPDFVATAQPDDQDPELLAYDLADIAADYLQPLRREKANREDARQGSERNHVDDEPAIVRLELDVRGIHCQSCVVVCERSLERLPEVERVAVDYQTGRARVDFRAREATGATKAAPGRRLISRAVRQLRLVGYDGVPLKPGRKTEALREEGRGLLWKIVLSGFAAGNTMMLSIALWSGYFDGSLPAEYKRLFEWLQFVLTTPIFFYAARGFHRGWRGFFRTGVPGMDVLISAGISAAYFYSVFVFLRPMISGFQAVAESVPGLTITIAATSEVYFDSVAMIVFLLLIGRYLEWRARLGQRERMESLLRPLPDYCFRVGSANTNANASASASASANSASPQARMIPVNHLAPGDLVLLRAGDRVPADGVLSGPHACDVDEAVLTGEARSVARAAGDRLLAGSRIILIGDEQDRDAKDLDHLDNDQANNDNFVLLKISATPQDSSLGILSRMTDATGDRRSRTEERTGRLVPWFGFGVIAVAAGSFTYFYGIAGAGLDQALLAAVSVLIVSCPCALALSVPTAAGAALFRGLREGVLFRDGRVLEEIDTIRSFCFDKTGTLTTGRPRVIASHFYKPERRRETIAHIRRMESGTMHPIGLALLDFARREVEAENTNADMRGEAKAQELTRFATNIDTGDAASHRVQAIAGRGLYLPGADVRLGSLEFLHRSGQREELRIDLGAPNHATLIGIARGEKLLAVFALDDSPRPDARDTLDFLRERGCDISILTGDQKEPALRLATDLGVPAASVHAGLLPGEKTERLRAMTKGPVCMVGDGFNDAPALAAADLSVVHALSAPLSLEQAGVVLLNNRLSELRAAIRIAGGARRVMRANLGFSLLYNAIMIPLAAAGLLLPIWCALFMALSSLTVIGSSAMFRLRFRAQSGGL